MIKTSNETRTSGSLKVSNWDILDDILEVLLVVGVEFLAYETFIWIPKEYSLKKWFWLIYKLGRYLTCQLFSKKRDKKDL